MTVTVSITQPALASILRSGQCGLLVGLHDGGNLVILSAAYCSLDELASSKEAVTALLPPPLAVLGAHVTKPEDAAAAQQALGSGSAVAIPVDGGLECSVGGSSSRQPVSVLPSSSGTAGGVATALADAYLPARCSIDLVVQVATPAAGSGGSRSEAVAAAFEGLKQQVCGSDTVYLAEAASSSADSGQLVKLALPGSAALEAIGSSWTSPLLLRPYCGSGAGGASAASRECTAPTLCFQPGKADVSCAALHVDVLCYAPKGLSGREVVESVVRPAVAAQLELMCQETQRRGELAPLRALHFLPPGLPHHVTLVYPLPTPSIEDDEEGLLSTRLTLHSLLGLPTNRPLLRVANALDFDSSSGNGSSSGTSAGGSAAGGVGGRPRLADVHLGLAPSGVGGSVHLIQGTYDYYHYMQDKFDDNGWGCAYRSLQTICSWFAKQLYTSKGVPSHREIQQTLASIGDKQQAFVGSKQWIGAIELGFVLDTLLGVPCKVITVPSGADMPTKAREIAHHFDTQGTPIMIGGGVLAYTLLGIDFNERTGDCAFLILDPHYTGAEDLKRIHAGQWVAWKKLGDKAAAGGELFVKDAFYNLLCPQRPNTV